MEWGRGNQRAVLLQEEMTMASILWKALALSAVTFHLLCVYCMIERDRRGAMLDGLLCVGSVLGMLVCLHIAE